MPVARGRARGRFPLREPAYKPPQCRVRPPAQPRLQTVAIGLAAETDAVFAHAPAFSAGTDTFSYSNGPLGAPWLPWTVGTGPASLTVTGGSVAPAVTLGDASYPVSIGPDCHTEAVINGTMVTGMSYGVAVRLTAHSSGADGYMAELVDTGGGARLNIYKGSGFTTLAAPGTLYPSADVDALRLSAVGDAITGYLRIAGVWTVVASATDATYTAGGYPGFWVQDGSAVGGSLTQVKWGPPVEIHTVTAGQASETDTPQVIRSRKNLAAGLAAATNTALPATARKSKTLGQPSDTSAALAATHRKTVTPGQASETGSALQLHGNIFRLIGQAAETETAQTVVGVIVHRTGAGRSIPVGSRGRERGRFPLRGAPWQPPATVSRSWSGSEQGANRVTVTAVGQATETELALNFVTAPKVIPVGQAAETELAFGVLRQRRVRSGFPYPVDTIIAGAFIVVTQVTDPQAALAATHRKTKTLGQASETEASFGVGAIGAKVISVGLATETQTAQPATRRKTRALGLAASAQTAQAVVHSKARTVGQAAETEAAQTARAARVKAIGQATESDSSLAATRVRSRTLGQTLEFQSGPAHTHRKTKMLGQASETESARPVTIIGSDVLVVEITSSTETSQPVTRAKRAAVGLPQGNETAFPVLPRKFIAVGLATETAVAHPIELNPLQIRLIGVAGDPAIALRIIRRGTATVYEPISTGFVRRPHHGTAKAGKPGTATKGGVYVP